MTARPGWYIYIGSAFGPGGVRARVHRHRRRAKRTHWHIDHLRKITTLVEVWYTHDPTPREHDWARALAASPGATIPLPGFGASGCRCATHLLFFTARPALRAFRRRLGAHEPHQILSER